MKCSNTPLQTTSGKGFQACICRFHVDDLSSAHVYLLLQPGWTIDTLPEPLLTDCAQLVKANSIEGNKASHVKIVYTPVSNLKKEAGFDVGQVTFKNMKMRRFAIVEKRVNETVNRLNKTKVEKDIQSLVAKKEERFRTEKEKKKVDAEKKKADEMTERKRLQEDNELRTYSSAMKSERMTSNKLDKDLDVRQYEEDFFQ